MPRKKEVSPEEKKTQELNKNQKLENSALKERKTTVERNLERKTLLLDRFGPKSKLDNINHSVYNEKDMSRYNAIKLPKPKGLTDEMIAMIAIGEAMNPKRLKGALTSSTVAGNLNQLSWNQSLSSRTSFQVTEEQENSVLLCAKRRKRLSAYSMTIRKASQIGRAHV